MPKENKTKQTFGTVRIDHFSPKLPAGTPKGINITLSFEEALKLHLGLLQALGRLNSYNRSTRDGKASAVNLCVFTDLRSITINEDQLAPPKPDTPAVKTQDKTIEKRLREYEREVEASGLGALTKQTYLLHARNFVRWLSGDFTPGIRKQG